MKKVKFTADELQAIQLLKGDGIYFDPGNAVHKKLKYTLSDLFFKGLMDRGDKAINHLVLSSLGKKGLDWNRAADIINS